MSTPPYDEATEAAVLGAVMVSADCLAAAAAAGWSPDHCYLPAHRRIAVALLEHVVEADTIDDRTSTRTIGYLRDRGQLEEGDARLIADAILGACPSAPGVAVDAEHLVDLARRRAMLADAEALRTAALSGVVA